MEHLLYAAILLAAVAVRVVGLGAEPLSPSESAAAWSAWLAANAATVAGAPAARGGPPFSAAGRPLSGLCGAQRGGAPRPPEGGVGGGERGGGRVGVDNVYSGDGT